MKETKLFVRIVCIILAALMALSVLLMALPARSASVSAMQETEYREIIS